MQVQNEEMMALVMEQYNNMSVSMEEEKKAKLEQLYDQIVSFQESIDSAKATLETMAREAETDARVSPEALKAYWSVVSYLTNAHVYIKFLMNPSSICSPISHLRTFLKGNVLPVNGVWPSVFLYWVCTNILPGSDNNKVCCLTCRTITKVVCDYTDYLTVWAAILF